MPAVKYDYDYYNNYRSSAKGVAKSAMSSKSSSASAQRKVSPTTKRSVTPESTRNSTRVATRAVSSSSHKSVTQSKKRAHSDIDIPVMVKKKVELQKPAEMKLTKPKSKSKSSAKTDTLGKNVLVSFLIAFTLFFICMRYIQINEKFNEVNSLEKDLSTSKALNQQLNATIDNKTDLSYIEKYAKYQLGMQKPTDDQIVRIAYEKHDKISTPIIIEEENEMSFFEKLFNDLKNLAD